MSDDKLVNDKGLILLKEPSPLDSEYLEYFKIASEIMCAAIKKSHDDLAIDLVLKGRLPKEFKFYE